MADDSGQAGDQTELTDLVITDAMIAAGVDFARSEWAFSGRRLNEITEDSLGRLLAAMGFKVIAEIEE